MSVTQRYQMKKSATGLILPSTTTGYIQRRWEDDTETAEKEGQLCVNQK